MITNEQLETIVEEIARIKDEAEFDMITYRIARAEYTTKYVEAKKRYLEYTKVYEMLKL